jgi:endo-1,4-beta-xylanase
MRKKAFILTTLLFLIGLWAVWWHKNGGPISLRQAAEARKLRIGVTDAGFGSVFYENTVPYEFNSLTPESVMKFENIHPCPPTWLIESNASVAAWVREHGADRPETNLRCSLENATDDEWQWEGLDRLLTWTNTHNIGFRGHTFLWTLQNPGWIIHESITLTVEERQRTLEEHIRTAIEHTCTYANLYAYDVVNEAIQPDGTLVSNAWSPIPNYIDLAFRTARQSLEKCHRLDVKLYYNDFGFEYGEEKADAIYTYLGSLLLRPNPTPINGIGFQTHSQTLYDGIPTHDPAALTATLDRFTNGLGLETALTETDLPIAAEDRSAWYDQQARWMSERLQACLSAVKCAGYTLWGTHDGESWRVYFKGDFDPLIFYDTREKVYDPDLPGCVEPGAVSLPGNERFCPKPAFQALLEQLKQR